MEENTVIKIMGKIQQQLCAESCIINGGLTQLKKIWLENVWIDTISPIITAEWKMTLLQGPVLYFHDHWRKGQISKWLPCYWIGSSPIGGLVSKALGQLQHSLQYNDIDKWSHHSSCLQSTGKLALFWTFFVGVSPPSGPNSGRPTFHTISLPC